MKELGGVLSGTPPFSCALHIITECICECRYKSRVDMLPLHYPKFVRLKSGGPKMEVVALSPSMFLCQWLSDEGIKQRARFPRCCLDRVVKLWLITPNNELVK